MILVAPDKFKGTLSARQAAKIITEALGSHDILMAPMADGGEGTADVLCRGLQWEKHDCYYVDPIAKTAVIDSSAVIGLQGIDLNQHDILRASSAPLGIKVREILKGGCERVIIGIGGTSTCDGGLGFVEALDIDKLSAYKHSIIGLSDVCVPLYAPPGQPSALMFARQKGATDMDMDVLARRLESIYSKYPHHRSEFDGAGGGLGFAIASLIGAKCYRGAEYVLDSYKIDWSRISLIITGEGRIDCQTEHGKVVGTIMKKALEYAIPVVAFGGCVDNDIATDCLIATDMYYPELPLNRETAAIRLKAAVESNLDIIARLMD